MLVLGVFDDADHEYGGVERGDECWYSGVSMTLVTNMEGLLWKNRLSILSVFMGSHRWLAYECFDDADHEYEGILP